MKAKCKVIIAGVQGYTGNALMHLVDTHPYLEFSGVHSRLSDVELYQEMPSLQAKGIPVYHVDALIEIASKIDVIFLATPVDVSMTLVLALKDTGVMLVDLSGAFRLPEDMFNAFYGMSHTAPHFFQEATYGLSPWMNISAHRVVANPGCYATCALMALLPLIQHHLLDKNSIIIDAKSGVSGAGKGVNSALMFCEMANNFYPYKIGKHQHLPEIQQMLMSIGGYAPKIRLTTSMLPLVRGMSMSIYAKSSSNLPDKEISQAVFDAYQAAYSDYLLVKYHELGSPNDHDFLALNKVIHTPYCHIAYHIQEDDITLYTSIDNLLKGAASQAIENVNCAFKWPLHTGLLEEIL